MILGFKTQVKGKPTRFKEKILAGSKIHTFREDKNRHWAKGMLIQFATGVRTKSYSRFKDGTCTGTQAIKIEPFQDEMFIDIKVYVDGRHITGTALDRMIANDGFDCRLDFYEWFKGGFDGFIIHWTDFRY